ncbi:MAG TPA: Na+/H+ antiporter NhaA, partial [Acidimicrobiia bacterium]
IVPIFALANAGVTFAGVDLGEALVDPVTLGVFFGLVVGKLVGVSAFASLAVATGLGRLPRGTDWRHVVGLAALAGIGFTVALFITELAFVDETITDFAKIGTFAASIAAGVLGYAVLRAHRSGPHAP